MPVKGESIQDSFADMERLLPEENPVDVDDAQRLVVDGRPLDPEYVRQVLSPHVTAERLARIDSVVARRTRSVSVVVEGIANAGNVSAVMRTAEALGFFQFHVILGEIRYKTSGRTTQGAEKWLDVYRWERPEECVAYLKERGFRVLATSLDDAHPIGTYDFTTGRTAVVFGNEREGISKEMLDLCDGRIVVPIQGFAQSFNISVAAALAMYHIRQSRTKAAIDHGDLTPSQRTVLSADYLIRSMASAPMLIRRALNDLGASQGG